ncbi:hypothetical protein [Sandarakinorhabdus sp.]|uniref:hypothetical protein n=1 Tax=Sandarakinorhabdus sp. TaxID=1916663 RepID=UPI003F728720
MAQITLIIAQPVDIDRALFWLGEIDAKLANRRALLAHRCDGQPLPAENGPLRLVVACEARATRSIRQLVALRVPTLC